MDFDNHAREFILDPEDMEVLRVPQELGRWPLRDAGHLIDEIYATQNRLVNMYETQFPYGAGRHEIRAIADRHKRVLRQICGVVAEHANVGEEAIQKLLEL